MVIHGLDDLGYPYDLGNLHWSNDPHLIAVKTIRFPAVKYGRVTVARTTTKRPMMCSTRSCFWSNTSSEVSNIHSDSPAINLPFFVGWWSRKIHRVSFRDSATDPGLKPRKSSNQDGLEHKNHCNASHGLREYNVVTTTRAWYHLPTMWHHIILLQLHSMLPTQRRPGHGNMPLWAPRRSRICHSICKAAASCSTWQD